MNRIIQEAEHAAARGEQGTLYKITKKISAQYNSGSSVVRDNDCKILTKEKDIQERWVEHFKEVLNREPSARPVRIEKGRDFCNVLM